MATIASLQELADAAPLDGGEGAQTAAWLARKIEAGKGGMFMEVVTLTPELAHMLLADNPENRKLKATKVQQYATDIREGNWQLNGEAIKVSIEGELNDGQHRCEAVAAAGRSIQTPIVFGCERHSRTTLDQGAARTPGDYLAMEGHANSNALGAAAAYVWQFLNRGALSSQGKFRPTKAQIMETAKRHPGLADSVRFVPTQGSGALGGRGFLAFCHFIFACRSEPHANEFILKLIRGNDLKLRDPIHTVRQRFITSKPSDPQDKALLVFKAWSLYREGKTSQVLRPGKAGLQDLAK